MKDSSLQVLIYKMMRTWDSGLKTLYLQKRWIYTVREEQCNRTIALLSVRGNNECALGERNNNETHTSHRERQQQNGYYREQYSQILRHDPVLIRKLPSRPIHTCAQDAEETYSACVTSAIYVCVKKHEKCHYVNVEIKFVENVRTSHGFIDCGLLHPSEGTVTYNRQHVTFM